MRSEETIVLGRSGREMLTYLGKPRPWASKAFPLHFILNGAIMLNWKPEMIIGGLKIMCMKME